MLSYAWSSQSLVDKVYDYLTCRGLSVWMDTKNGSIQHNNIYDAMAAGVSNASVVLVFMTEDYEKSDNCKNELSLCGDSKIPRIPILAQKDWKPTPSKWLAFLTAGKLWIQMDEFNYRTKMEELVQHIRYVVPAVALLLSPPPLEPPLETSPVPVPAPISCRGSGLLGRRATPAMPAATNLNSGGLLGRKATQAVRRS